MTKQLSRVVCGFYHDMLKRMRVCVCESVLDVELLVIQFPVELHVSTDD